MKDDTTITPLHQPGSIIDPLSEMRVRARARCWPRHSGQKRRALSPSSRTNDCRLTPTHAVKSGRRYRYYAAANGSASFRISAGEIEPVVTGQVAAFLGRTGELLDELGAGQLGPDVLKVAMARTSALATEFRSGSGADQREIVVALG